VGGVLLAMEQVGVNPSPIREHLIKSTRKLLDEKVIPAVNPIPVVKFPDTSTS
jgi:hypothetical protein